MHVQGCRFSIQLRPSLPTMNNVLTPYNCAFLLIDFQTRLAPSIHSSPWASLLKNAVDLAKTARILNVPTLLTTLGLPGFGGPLIPRLEEVCGRGACIDRAEISLFEDEDAIAILERSGRKRLVVAGLCTEFRVVPSVVQALSLGYQVNLVVDACGDISEKAHSDSLHLMCEAGATPWTWLQVYLEWERSLLHPEAFQALYRAAGQHAAVYGLDLTSSSPGSRGAGPGPTRPTIPSWHWVERHNRLIPEKQWLS
jgi:nicotinamidase-related amidase